MLNKIKWCNSCNVPIAGEACDICGSDGQYCAKDLKPIFTKERKLYEKLLGIRLPPFAFRYRNRIIVEGKTFITFKIDTINNRLIPLYRAPIKSINNESIKKGIERTIKANLNLLKEREQTAIDFIRSAVKNYSQAIALFGGGKDSAATAILAGKAIGNISLLFIDTTLEFPETYNFVKRFSRLYNFPLIRDDNGRFYKAEQNFFSLCERIGPPSIYCRWCCHIFKEQPVRYFISDHLSDYDDIVFLTGIRKGESRRRGNFSYIESGKRITGQTLVQPINQWSDFEVWLYTFWRSININDLYKSGHARVGCWPCPCTPPLMDFIRKITHPHLWNRFEKILYKYAEENCRFETWIRGGLWRLRRPNRQKVLIYPIDITENGVGEISFKYIFPLKKTFFEFFKIVGSIEVNNNCFVVRTRRNFELKGQIIGANIELIVTCSKLNYVNVKSFIEKILFRSVNCIGCGSCSSSCPRGALKIVNGKLAVLKSCDKCGLCLKNSCAIEDSENYFMIRLDPFSLVPCEKGLPMNHIIFADKQLGTIIANKLKEKGVNTEIHEEGKVVCVDANFPKSEIALMIKSSIKNWLLYSN